MSINFDPSPLAAAAGHPLLVITPGAGMAGNHDTEIHDADQIIAQMSEVNSLQAVVEAVSQSGAPLDVRLDILTRKIADLDPEFATAYDRIVAQLATAKAGAGAPKQGERMPDFLLPAEPGGLTSLSNLLAEGPVVISFNRGHWCSYCSIELCALAEAERRIAAAGAKVAVIMPDLPQFMQPTVVETSGKFTFLSDVDNGYALEIGLVMWVGDHLAGLMRADKLNLPSFQGNDSWFLPLPATFVVGRDGIILARFVHPDFRRRLNVEAIVAALERAT